MYEGGRQFETKAALQRQILRSWTEISSKWLQGLMDTMSSRMADVLELKGTKTTY